jgi:general secretion pathway protein H
VIRNSIRSGFTLLELLVVLVVISLVSGFVGPRLAGSLTQLNLKTGSKKLASALRYARSQAASQCVAYVVLLNFEDRKATVQAQERDAPTEKEADVSEIDGDLRKERPKHFQLPEGIRFDRVVSGDEEWDAGAFSFAFYPDGGSSGGRVILADEKDRRYRIDVDFVTGIVTVKADQEG